MHSKNTKVKLAILACTDMASEHKGIERSSMSRMNVAIDIVMSTFAVMQLAVTIGGCLVNKDHVIIKTILRDDCLSGVIL